jgi:hypothetical protein
VISWPPPPLHDHSRTQLAARRRQRRHPVLPPAALSSGPAWCLTAVANGQPATTCSKHTELGHLHAPASQKRRQMNRPYSAIGAPSARKATGLRLLPVTAAKAVSKCWLLLAAAVGRNAADAGPGAGAGPLPPATLPSRVSGSCGFASPQKSHKFRSAVASPTKTHG